MFRSVPRWLFAALLVIGAPQVARADDHAPAAASSRLSAELDAAQVSRSLGSLRNAAPSLGPRAPATIIEAPTREAGGETGGDATDETGTDTGTDVMIPVPIGVTATLRRMEIERVLASIGVEAVYFATMQTGNVKLAFSGTITEQGADSYTYAQGPEDRLRVTFKTGQSVDYLFQDFTGDYSQPDATRFLRRDHSVAFRLVASWGTDVTAHLQKSGGRYLNALNGTVVDGQSTYEIATTTQGEVISDIGPPGVDYHSREGITGTVSANGLKINIDENFRYHFVVFDNAVEDIQHRIGSSWVIGNDRYALNDGNIFRTFKNGVPSEIDSWKASGILTRNGTQIGGIGMTRADFTIDTVLQAGDEQTIIYSDRAP